MLPIRKATACEIQKILDYSPIVMKEATMGFSEENGSDTAIQMMSQVLENGGYYLVYPVEEMVQGWIGIGYFHHFYSDETLGILTELYVLPQHRYKGIAEKLFESALNMLEQENIKKVQLNVYAGNAIKSLYEKYGFYDVSTLMQKDLD
jgi:ribosomal protein S18 acetylase RimI-like enzyme